jgi:hypothetical protein
MTIRIPNRLALYLLRRKMLFQWIWQSLVTLKGEKRRFRPAQSSHDANFAGLSHLTKLPENKFPELGPNDKLLPASAHRTRAKSFY